jgi:hypothetical protein
MSYGIYRKSELNAMVSSADALDIICGAPYGVLLLGPFIAAVRLIATGSCGSRAARLPAVQ